MLETDRLLLPPLTREHTAALVDLYSDPAIARYIGGARLTPDSIPLQTATLADEWDERGYGQSAVLLRETGEFVGRAGLHYWPIWDEVELGYVIAARVQRRGLAQEASRAWIDWSRSSLERDSLVTVIQPANAASVALAVKLGFAFDRSDVTATGDAVELYRLPLR
jgi:RimJ/RimL family protein N-acetyltransferase